MTSYSEYYRRRLEEQTMRLKDLDKKEIIIHNITGNKRTYENAMGYPNDYLVVQDPESIETPRGINWIDSYLENLSNKQK